MIHDQVYHSFRTLLVDIGALTIRIGFWGHDTIIIIRNTHTLVII